MGRWVISTPPTNDNALCICADGLVSPTTSDNPVFRCAEGDMCKFGTLTVQTNHNCTCGCGGYRHVEFFGFQEKKKRYLKTIALITHMCQKISTNLGNTELTYKPPIDIEDGDLYSKEEEKMNYRPRRSLRLNTRSTSSYPVCKKQPT